LRRALARVSARRLHPGGGFVDMLTGLPNGRAVLRALLRKAEWARQGRATVSLVFLHVKAGEVPSSGHGEREWLLEVGAALQRHVRRTEVGGRLARMSFAVVVLGDRSVACGAALRLESLLASRGIAVAAAAVEVNLARPALRLQRERGGLGFVAGEEPIDELYGSSRLSVDRRKPPPYHRSPKR
jgi:PleD family two-component response regulator